MNNFVYILDGTAYVNLTNRCQNACGFCIRNTGDGVAGVNLRLDRDATADEVIKMYAALGERHTTREVVFCGFGEPTEALGVLCECAKRFKSMELITRLNTNGLGSLSAGRNIAPELAPCIDKVSVSLNHCDEKNYAAVTNSRYGERAFGAVLEFVSDCKKAGIDTTVSVVDVIGEAAVEKCRALAKSLGVPLRVREYVPDNYNDRITTEENA